VFDAKSFFPILPLTFWVPVGYVRPPSGPMVLMRKMKKGRAAS
jgi:hypothetical protein